MLSPAKCIARIHLKKLDYHMMKVHGGRSTAKNQTLVKSVPDSDDDDDWTLFEQGLAKMVIHNSYVCCNLKRVGIMPSNYAIRQNATDLEKDRSSLALFLCLYGVRSTASREQHPRKPALFRNLILSSVLMSL
ncbi:hypothetical protein EMPG_11936 [Blastomyces silverae]|uniref:Uncharacterized protein n=1 Tax=Blastomyces silverae TaxID=2060906 RepID=A0A0H1BPY9_9EURO|nr:hypothetical protein EMPG_11936 [Blastomyces silverae]